MHQKYSPNTSTATDKENVSVRKKWKGTRIRTVIRLRGDVECDGVIVTQNEDGDSVALIGDKDKNTYMFDRVLGPKATQKDVYDAVIRKFVAASLYGQNCCILAYGQTGSGKTHSMLGTVDDPGILPLFAQDLCDAVEKRCNDSKVTLLAAFYEVYSEKVYDLLGSKRTPLNFTTARHIAGLTKVQVTSFEEIRDLQAKGLKRRVTSATVFNETSSRSHAIFEISVHQELEVHGKTEQVLGQCFFVDLAGNERSREVNEAQWSEGVNINKSLLALQRVVSQRATNEKHVAYRGSLLTRILEPCIAGNANVTVLGAICPTKNCAPQTTNTLQFVSTARLVTVTPRSNRDTNNIIDTIPDYRGHLVKTLKDAEKQLVIMNRPEGACIVELFPDISANQWHCLHDGFDLKSVKDKTIVVFTAENAKWFVLAKDEGVDLNNVQLDPNVKVELKHSDCIVLHESRFFVVSLEASCDPAKFKYESVKVKYMEATTARFYQRLKEKALAEARAVMDDFNEKLVGEIATMQFRVEQLEEKGGAMKSRLKKQAQLELQKDIEDAVAIHAEISKQVEAASTAVAAPPKSDAPVGDSQDVEILNEIFMEVGITEVQLAVYMRANRQIGGVRLFHKESGMHANLDYGRLELLKERVGDALQFCDDSELNGTVAAILYKLELQWERTDAATSSYFLQDIVKGCIMQTATRRKSSVFEVTSKLKKRDSVIASMVSSDLVEESDCDQILKMAVKYLDVPTITKLGEGKSSLCKNFLQDVNSGYVYVSAAKYEDITTNQKKSAYLSLAAKLRRIFMMLDIGVKAIRGSKCHVDYDPELTEICEKVDTLQLTFKTFLRQVTMEEDVSQIFEEFKSGYQRMLQTIGHFLFSITLMLPKELREIAPFVHVGFLSSVDRLLAAVLRDTKDQSMKTFCGYFRHASADAVEALREGLGTAETFDTGYFVDVMIPAFRNWQSMMGNGWKSPDPGEFYKGILETITRKYDGRTSSETKRVLRKMAELVSKQHARLRKHGFCVVVKRGS